MMYDYSGHDMLVWPEKTRRERGVALAASHEILKMSKIASNQHLLVQRKLALMKKKKIQNSILMEVQLCINPFSLPKSLQLQQSICLFVYFNMFLNRINSSSEFKCEIYHHNSYTIRILDDGS